MKKGYIIFIVIISLFYSCTQTTKEKFVTGIPIPVFPPQHLAAEELIFDYDTIRLESSSQSLLSGIHQIHIMNEKLYVTDNSQCIIFIYDMKGKYLSKICNQGEGPEEYIRITSFETDPINHRLLVTDNFSKRLFEYDEYGNLQKVISLKFSPTLITSDKYNRYVHLNSALMDENYKTPQMNNDCIHIITNQGEIGETFLEDETPNPLDICGLHSASYSSTGELLYMPILSDTIYRIEEHQAVAEFYLDNHSKMKNLTKKDKENIFYTFEKNNLEDKIEDGYLISWGNFLASDSLVFLNLGWRNNPFFVFYLKNTLQSLSISLDERKGNKGWYEVLSVYPKAIQGDTLYINLSFERMQYVLPLLPDGKLKTFLTNMTEDDNPCIIAYRINKELFQPPIP